MHLLSRSTKKQIQFHSISIKNTYGKYFKVFFDSCQTSSFLIEKLKKNKIVHDTIQLEHFARKASHCAYLKPVCCNEFRPRVSFLTRSHFSTEEFKSIDSIFIPPIPLSCFGNDSIKPHTYKVASFEIIAIDKDISIIATFKVKGNKIPTTVKEKIISHPGYNKVVISQVRVKNNEGELLPAAGLLFIVWGDSMDD